MKFSQVEEPQQTDLLPDRPLAYGNLGRHVGVAGALPGPNDRTQAAGGPNNEVFYLVEVPVTAVSHIHLNRVALAVGSAFYNLQGTKRKNKPGDTKDWCARADVPPFLTTAINHEGLGSPPPAGSHAAVWRRELNANVPQAVEDVVHLGIQAPFRRMPPRLLIRTSRLRCRSPMMHRTEPFQILTHHAGSCSSKPHERHQPRPEPPMTRRMHSIWKRARLLLVAPHGGRIAGVLVGTSNRRAGRHASRLRQGSSHVGISWARR